MADATQPNPTPRPQPWEQQPGEPDKAFAAFTVFCTLGVQRTLLDAYRISTGASGGRAGKPSATFYSWSSNWDWANRAHAYDVHESGLKREARINGAIAEAGEQGRKSAEEEWADRSNQIRETSWEMFVALKRKIQEMLSVAIIKRKVVEPAEGRPQQIIYEPAKWSFFTLTQMINTMDTVGRMAAEMPATLADLRKIKDATDGDGDSEAMFAITPGLLEDALPAGVVPAMPVEAASKPQINVQREAEGGGVRQPQRLRPTARPGGRSPGVS
jgi:hypothetical protein